MAAGIVTLAADGTATTSTGSAGRLYTILLASVAGVLPGGIPAGAAGYGLKKGQADIANSFASWLDAELASHTTADVGTGLAGVQRMPASTAVDTPTKAPAATVSIPLVHAL